MLGETGSQSVVYLIRDGAASSTAAAPELIAAEDRGASIHDDARILRRGGLIGIGSSGRVAVVGRRHAFGGRPEGAEGLLVWIE